MQSRCECGCACHEYVRELETALREAKRERDEWDGCVEAQEARIEALQRHVRALTGQTVRETLLELRGLR